MESYKRHRGDYILACGVVVLDSYLSYFGVALRNQREVSEVTLKSRGGIREVPVIAQRSRSVVLRPYKKEDIVLKLCYKPIFTTDTLVSCVATGMLA